MRSVILMFLLFSSSCAILLTKPTVQLVRVPNIEIWKGRNADELTLHPIYATLALEKRKTTDGLEIRAYRNSAGSVSKSNCLVYGQYGSGFCESESNEVACNHVFYISQNKISDLKRVGACGPEDIMFRPLDHEGNPVLSEVEQESLERKIASEGPISCEKTSECQGTKSCKNGTCGHYGIWGLLFN